MDTNKDKDKDKDCHRDTETRRHREKMKMAHAEARRREGKRKKDSTEIRIIGHRKQSTQRYEEKYTLHHPSQPFPSPYLCASVAI